MLEHYRQRPQDRTQRLLITRFHFISYSHFSPSHPLSHDFQIRFHGIRLYNTDVAQFTPLRSAESSRGSRGILPLARERFDKSVAQTDLSTQSRVNEFATPAVTTVQERKWALFHPPLPFSPSLRDEIEIFSPYLGNG